PHLYSTGLATSRYQRPSSPLRQERSRGQYGPQGDHEELTVTDTSTVLGGARPAVEHATVAYVKQGFQIAGLPGKELLDLENLRLNLEKKITQEKIRSYQISGADEGSDEHRLLLYYVFAKGLPGNWGTEFHVRLPCEVG